MNLGLEGTLRFTKWFRLEGGLMSHTLGSTGTGGLEGLYREAGFWAGGGFKLPNPFLWGVRFENMTITRLSDKSNRPYSTWEFFVEYSF